MEPKPLAFLVVARKAYLLSGNHMKHLLALRQAKQEKLDKMNALLSSVTSENRSLNKDEQSTIDTFKTEVRNLNSQIEAAELVVDENTLFSFSYSSYRPPKFNCFTLGIWSS